MTERQHQQRQHDHTGHDKHRAPAARQGHDEHAGHPEHGGHAGHAAMFGRLLFIMLVLAVPVIGFNAMFADLVGYQLPESGIVPWIAPVLGTVMYVWGGRPFLTGGIREAKDRAPGMMLLVGLAITVAFLASWGASLGLLDARLDFWWELALLVVIMLLGHWLEMRSLASTSGALESLAALLPDTAERFVGADGEDLEQVDPADLATGDLVLVRPGATVPADGRLTSGVASFDESLITGESVPVRHEAGEDVVAGTIATDASVRVEVTATGEETALAGIRRLVADAQSSSSRAQRLADRAAGWLFWYALGAGLLTALVWALLGSPEQAVVRTITVLVIACPHALGLAIPLVVSLVTERAARSGVLVADRIALETMRTVDAVVFDKTGTLTVGEPAVLAVEPIDGREVDEVLALAAAAEAESEHPLAAAIRAAAAQRSLTLPHATGFRTDAGSGIAADIEGRSLAVGGPQLLDAHEASELPIAESWRSEGSIILHVLQAGTPIGAVALADAVREESRGAVDALHRDGIEVIMMTGDAQAVADTVAGQLGIDRVYAGVRPEHKEQRVAELQREGRTVAMVGDGVNDAPALARADVGVAIGAGTDVAIGSAGVVLAGSDPRGVQVVRRLSSAAYRKMVQNLWWAAGYNLLAVPLAAGVLAPIGFVLPMSVGALLMSASTIVVALNAQTLRRLDLRPEAVVS